LAGSNTTDCQAAALDAANINNAANMTLFAKKSSLTFIAPDYTDFPNYAAISSTAFSTTALMPYTCFGAGDGSEVDVADFADSDCVALRLLDPGSDSTP